MRASSSNKFKDAVQNVLANVQKKSGLPPDNPYFATLTRLLKNRVREVESSKTGERPIVRDWTRGRLHRTRSA